MTDISQYSAYQFVLVNWNPSDFARPESLLGYVGNTDKQCEGPDSCAKISSMKDNINKGRQIAGEHKEMNGGEHNHNMHTAHKHHDHYEHYAHMVQDFKRRFWVSLILTVPILILSPMIQRLVGLGELIRFPAAS